MQWFTDLAYEPLIRVGADGKLKPGLAKSWGYVGDGTREFRLTLRSGAKFSDGSPVTASAVKESLEYFTDKGSKGELLDNVTSITTDGKKTLDFKLKVPSPIMATLLSSDHLGASYIIGPSGLAHPDSLTKQTAGAGQYVLDTADTVANSRYVYTANPKYYDPSAVHWKKIVFKVIEDANGQLSALQTGQVDVIQGTAKTAPTAAKSGLKVVSGPSVEFGIMIPDAGGAKVPALGKPEVRRALNYAVDRASITKALFGTYAKVDQQYLAPGAVGYDEDLAGFYPYDMAKARRLMAAAGYPHGFSATLLVTPQVGVVDMVQAVTAGWAKLGVKIKIESPTPAVWADDVQHKKWPLQANSLPLGNMFLNYINYMRPGASYNYWNYPFHDQVAIGKQAMALDPGSPRYADLMTRLNKSMLTNAIRVPVTQGDLILLTSKRVTGIKINSTYPVPDPSYWTPTGQVTE